MLSGGGRAIWLVIDMKADNAPLPIMAKCKTSIYHCAERLRDNQAICTQTLPRSGRYYQQAEPHHHRGPIELGPPLEDLHTNYPTNHAIRPSKMATHFFSIIHGIRQCDDPTGPAHALALHISGSICGHSGEVWGG